MVLFMFKMLSIFTLATSVRLGDERVAEPVSLGAVAALSGIVGGGVGFVKGLLADKMKEKMCEPDDIQQALLHVPHEDEKAAQQILTKVVDPWLADLLKKPAELSANAVSYQHFSNLVHYMENNGITRACESTIVRQKMESKGLDFKEGTIAAAEGTDWMDRFHAAGEAGHAVTHGATAGTAAVGAGVGAAATVVGVALGVGKVSEKATEEMTKKLAATLRNKAADLAVVKDVLNEYVWCVLAQPDPAQRQADKAAVTDRQTWEYYYSMYGHPGEEQ
eukprot:TRINITY_DN22008_c0_g1_i1.p1 TRINITY_DN22008_c0_g1~~TRINITY_DN22008_c0_g1_i1.p1  ORF type:complete len:277 (+),score=57.57 TRINITY_DN22008_c0_g1_i1:89-919(+)